MQEIKDRPVSLKTKFNIIKSKPFLLETGLMLTLISLIPLFVIPLAFMEKDKDLRYKNYDKINEVGQATIGQIIDIEMKNNESINGQIPAIISYMYTHPENGQVLSKIKTISPSRFDLKVSDSIDVKYLNNESILLDIEPVNFPFWIFLLIPSITLTIGLICISYILFYYRKIIKLFKTGIVKKAKVISMIKNQIPIFRSLATLQYSYELLNGHEIISKSTIQDYSLLNTLKQGQYIHVFVSKEDDKISCIIPKEEIIRNNWPIKSG